MKLSYAPKFKNSFCQFPENVKKKFYQKAGYLLRDIRHHSLRAKKYDEKRGIWQARVNRDIRVYFQTSKRKTKTPFLSFRASAENIPLWGLFFNTKRYLYFA